MNNDTTQVLRQILYVHGFKPDTDPRNELETWVYVSPDGTRSVSVEITMGETDDYGEPYDIDAYATSADTGYYAEHTGDKFQAFVLDAIVAHTTPETIQ